MIITKWGGEAEAERGRILILHLQVSIPSYFMNKFLILAAFFFQMLALIRSEISAL